MTDDKAERIWRVVPEIPEGFVASYGQVANLAQLPGYARFVGKTLSQLPKDTRLPWHRVVKATLELAQRDSSAMAKQRQLLAAEGVTFRGSRVESRHRWRLLPIPGSDPDQQ